MVEAVLTCHYANVYNDFSALFLNSCSCWLFSKWRRGGQQGENEDKEEINRGFKLIRYIFSFPSEVNRKFSPSK